MKDNKDLQEFTKRHADRLAEREAKELNHPDEGRSNTFTLMGHELKVFEDWLIAHNNECPYYDDGTQPSNPMGAIGGRLTYQFTPTGVGVAVQVMCACGSKIDLTDYDSW